jgi:hypothetical protein
LTAPLLRSAALALVRPIFNLCQPAIRADEPAAMKQTLLNERYPLFVLRLERAETRFQSVDEICDYFRGCIEAHRCGQFIAIFDHYAHTCALPDGAVAPKIRAAKNVIFCFGLTLPSAEILGLRPRSIGVAELDQQFVISFMEAPMPLANAAMEDWALGLKRQDSEDPFAAPGAKPVDDPGAAPDAALA